VPARLWARRSISQRTCSRGARSVASAMWCSGDSLTTRAVLGAGVAEVMGPGGTPRERLTAGPIPTTFIGILGKGGPLAYHPRAHPRAPPIRRDPCGRPGRRRMW
jgi:hypothetical protein